MPLVIHVLGETHTHMETQNTVFEKSNLWCLPTQAWFKKHNTVRVSRFLSLCGKFHLFQREVILYVVKSWYNPGTRVILFLILEAKVELRVKVIKTISPEWTGFTYLASTPV